MKSIKAYILLFFIILSAGSLLHAQSYEMTIRNIAKTSNSYEFDVYINSTGTSFTLTSYQCAINFNNQLAGSGTLTFTYLANTSELANYPRYAIGINKIDGKTEMTFASAGSPAVTITTAAKRVGRFRLQNSSAFPDYPVNLSWCFTGSSVTLVTGASFKNITAQSSHTVELSALKLIYAAEKAIFGNGALLRTKAGSMGTQVVYFPKNSSYIRFKVNIPKAGNWFAWGRFFYETSKTSANAVNLKLDGGTAKPFGNNKDYFNKWHWDGDGNVLSGALVNLPLGYLTAGIHDIVISGREVGSTVMIDQLLLTPETSYKPTDSNIKFLKENPEETEIASELPKEFELMQNYPNPFNPTTTIRFSLTNSSEVSLIVYDILGNEVTTLVDEIKESGLHEVTFNAGNLSSGVYLYVLKAGNYTATKKLMLMK